MELLRTDLGAFLDVYPYPAFVLADSEAEGPASSDEIVWRNPAAERAGLELARDARIDSGTLAGFWPVKTVMKGWAVVFCVPEGHARAGEGELAPTQEEQQKQDEQREQREPTSDARHDGNGGRPTAHPPLLTSPLSPPLTPIRDAHFDPPVQRTTLPSYLRAAAAISVGPDGEPRPVVPRPVTGGVDVSTLLSGIDIPSEAAPFVGATMGSPNMSAIWLGKGYTLIYNQHFADVLAPAGAHFGCSGATSWAVLAGILGQWTSVVLGGQGLHVQDKLVLAKTPTGEREMYTNQHWVTLSNQSFRGIFVSCVETTPRVLSERRGETLRGLTGVSSRARTLGDFEAGVLSVLRENDGDAPFAALYRVERVAERGRSTPTPADARDARVLLSYAGGVGVPRLHPHMPPTLGLTSKQTQVSLLDESESVESVEAVEELADSVPTSWPFAEALTTRQSVFVDCSHLTAGYIRAAGVPSTAVVIPITRDDDGVPGALLILGLNPRLPFDSAYASFLDVLKLQLATLLVSVRSYVSDQELIRQLAEVDHAKNLLFANVANDLLAPISLIAGPLDDLVDDVSGTASTLLSIARRNVRALRASVRMLVEVSALGPGVMSFARVNLGELSRDMASMFRRGVERNGVEYTIDCDVTPHEVFVDREGWEKVVVTTIGMAARYTRRGFIHFSVRYASGHAIVQFRSSSTGLPARLVHHIGELDYETARDDSPAGAVIHFALLKKLIDMHGGTLSVESISMTDSVANCGVSVTICLPLGSAHLPQEDILIGPEAPHELHLWEDWKDSEVETPTSGERRSWGVDPATLDFEPSDVILLVDDNADSLRYMRAIFEPFCTVREARSAREALAACIASPPDLVIADLMLPYENGNVLLSSLRAHGVRDVQTLPVIMLTPDDARELGADDYLVRPFNARELLSRGHMQLQLGKRRRDLEARVEERTAELTALMDESPMGIIRCGIDGGLTYANHAWYKQAGYPLDGDLSDWGTYLSPASQAEILSKWVEFIADPEQQTLEVHGQWLTGTWTAVKTIKMFKNEGETLVGFLGSCMDISEHKLNEMLQVERTLLAEQRRREAEEAKQQQELLIDITSHEIRNPISSLMQCSSLVKTNLRGLQEDLSASIASGVAYVPTPQLLRTIGEDLDALDSIYECALTQERISNDVLSLGKIQLDLLQMFDVETDIRAEAHRILNVFQNEARMNRVQMSLKFGDAFEALGVVSVKLDPVRFGQVVTNLLANAIRFVSASEVRRIELRLDVGTVPPVDGTCTKPAEPSAPLSPDSPLYLYTEVADTGPGLRPAELDNLFERFTQASAQTHIFYRGSGLGLYVCRKITELMGGRIEVASEYGAGSVFRFFVATRPCTGAVARRGPTLARVVDTPRRILVVEDNMINRTVLQRQLKHVGFKPESVGNGKEAVDRLRSGAPFDCVLMDLEMPVMDGYTATRILREDERAGGAGHAIIALTGNARQAQIDAKMRDFDAVVVKPYRLDDLLGKIEQVIKQRASGIRPGSKWSAVEVDSRVGE